MERYRQSRYKGLQPVRPEYINSMSQQQPRAQYSPHIAILGAGSIGCYIGGCLRKAGARVTFIGRQRMGQQLHENGMHLSDWRGRNSQLPSQEINFTLSIDVLAEADYVLVAVKSGDTYQVATTISRVVNPKAIIISLQNGVRNAQILRESLPQHVVLKGMVPFNVISAGNGKFHCGTEGDLIIEEHPQVEALLGVFENAQLPVTRSTNLTAIQWGKLLMNLNNSVNALSGIPLRDQIDDPRFRKITALSQKEALRLLKQAGISPARVGKVSPILLPLILGLPNWIFRHIAGAMLKIDPEARSSMYEDLQLCRNTEVDFINGEIVALARSMNLSAPVNQAIVELVHQAQQQKAGSPMIRADDLFQRLTGNIENK